MKDHLYYLCCYALFLTISFIVSVYRDRRNAKQNELLIAHLKIVAYNYNEVQHQLRLLQQGANDNQPGCTFQ